MWPTKGVGKEKRETSDKVMSVCEKREERREHRRIRVFVVAAGNQRRVSWSGREGEERANTQNGITYSKGEKTL